MKENIWDDDLFKSIVTSITRPNANVKSILKSLSPEEEQDIQEKLLEQLEVEKDDEKKEQIIRTLVELGENRIWTYHDARLWFQNNFSTLDIVNLPFSTELLDIISRIFTGETNAEIKRKLVISLGHWSEELCWQLHSPERNKFFTWSKQWLQQLSRDDIAAIIRDDSMKNSKKIEFIISLGKLPLTENVITELVTLLEDGSEPKEIRHAALIALLHQVELASHVQEAIISHLKHSTWKEVESFLLSYCPTHCFDCLSNGLALLDDIPPEFESFIMELVRRSSGITGDLLLNQLECLLAKGCNTSTLSRELESIILDSNVPPRTRHRALLILGTYFINQVDWKRIIEQIRREDEPMLVSSLLHVLATNDVVDTQFFNQFLNHENFIVRYEAENALTKKK